jgi:hypothetical protein
MTLEQTLLKLILKYEFYSKVKPFVTEEMFPSSLSNFFEIISTLHGRYERDLNIEEVHQFYLASNPTLSQAKKEVVSIIVTQLDESVVELSDDVSIDIIKQLWTKQQAEIVAQIAMEIIDNPQTDISTLIDAITNITDVPLEFPGIDEMEMSLEDILQDEQTNGQWTFNIPGFHIDTVGPGTFGVVFARPEAGKTAFWVSLTFAPEGFLAQGANVLAIINEEPAKRTFLRAVSAHTGFRREELDVNQDIAQARLAEIRGKYKLADGVSLHMSELDSYLTKNPVDIVVVDQLDKMKISGVFARDDERLRALYIYARSLSKKHNCLFLGICQANAEAEGRYKLSLDMMENSRTGKAAEADFVIGIGQGGTNQSDVTRQLNFCKNKITGIHEPLVCTINPWLSRYVA